MSQLKSIVTRLTSREGVSASAAMHTDHPGVVEYSSDAEEVREELESTLCAFRSFNYPEGFRIVITDGARETTISGRVEDHVAVIVSYQTGAPVSKSILRMIRRAVAASARGSAAA